MTDQSFREIQLSGKQLVFLFMASVVLAVSVFLLGVSVGRGVRENVGAAVTVGPPPVELLPSGEAPPPVTMSAADTKFHNELQGQSAGQPNRPPSSPTAPPSTAAADPPVVDEPRPAAVVGAAKAGPAATPSPSVAKPVSPTVPQTVAAAKPAPTEPAGQGWVVQIDAFKSRQNADTQVTQLKAKGYAAFVAPGGALFRVRVGPFAQKTEADKTNARLRQEGFRSSVTR